ncbi:Uncharacterized protein TCM_009774 [Theobroma cacao]|uniref:Uncharacterized protein n=1 Tax=Theobroma cacao TaxID=3641 RepID=A0A061E5A3_THECC|nr:Uncharacterized protein TCM_009774 [Theobroma cacao]
MLGYVKIKHGKMLHKNNNNNNLFKRLKLKLLRGPGMFFSFVRDLLCWLGLCPDERSVESECRSDHLGIATRMFWSFSPPHISNKNP